MIDRLKRVRRTARIIALAMAALAIVAALFVGHGYDLQPVANVALAILFACALVAVVATAKIRRQH